MAEPEPDRRRFDGIWLGKLVCEATVSGVTGWKYDLNGRVANGVFRAEIGQAGKPGSQIFHGIIESDGSAVIVQKGLTGVPDPYHRVPGTEFNQRYLTIFEGTRASGVG